MRPKRSEVHANLAAVLLEQGALDEAGGSARRALDLPWLADGGDLVL